MKKKILLILVALMPMLAKANYAYIDGIRYYLYPSYGRASVVSGNDNYSGSISIPSTVTYEETTYNVTGIGESAFEGCSGLTTISIPSSVTGIGKRAFWGCCSLTSVNIPSGVNWIAEEVFSGCTGLTSITIPNSVTGIGADAFYNCSGLTSVTIPNSVTSIGYGAFYKCYFTSDSFVNYSSLTSDNNWGATIFDEESSDGLIIKNNIVVGCRPWATVVSIPEGVTSIGYGAFQGCNGLTSVTIGNSVTSIGESAFEGCSGLASVTIGNCVTSIGRDAFWGCSGLTTVNIPGSVTSIGESAFYGCKDLTSVSIPSSVTSIGQNAFFVTGWYNAQPDGILYLDNWLIGHKGTKPIGDVTINSGTRGIADRGFYDCSDLTSVTIPNSVTSIGDHAFYDCTSLASVTIPNSVTSIGYYAFYDCISLASVTIPNSVTSIGKRAFSGCSGLTSITIPNSVTSISDGVFSFCTSLCSVTIPNSVTSIGNSAFSDCSSLKSVTILNSVTSIGDYAFYDCSRLTSVTIPNSVTSIGGYAFADCHGLKDIVIGSGVTSIGYFAFSGCSLRKVIVPDIAAWCSISFRGEGANPLCNAHHLYVDEETEITDLVIPEGVTSIGNSAFSGCSSLKSVTIPNSVTTIGNSAFSGCSSLKSVTIPNSVTSIGDSAFFFCSGLTSINIPNSVTSIGAHAFNSCSGLTSITIPNSVTSIGVAAFLGCSGLTSITIPNSVTSIEWDAFRDCTGLTSVSIGSSVTTIGSRAFADCDSLKDVYCNAEKVPNAYSDAFSGTDISQATLHVPGMCKEAYRTTSPWNQFGTIVSSSDEEPTITGMQLDNSSFDEWSIVSGSSGKDLYQPWVEGKTPYWDTYNTFATILSVSNSTYKDEDGRRYASLQTKFLAVKLVAGAIFTGSYIEVDATNSVLSLGRPFTERPTKMKFDFQYHTSTINRTGGTWKDAWGDYVSQSMYESLKGQPDSCQIYIALGDWEPVDYVDKSGGTHTCPYLIRTRPSQLHLFEPNDPHIIGYAQMTCGKDISSWTTGTLDIHYRSDRTPKYIIVYATSSKYGDFSTGGELSELNLDNIKLIYSSIPDIDPEPVDSIPGDGGTFVEKLANGVEMEFKVVSREGKTCQVGSGTSHCIDTNTTGEITIPSEVRELNVVAIGDNAFSQCNDLSSVTLPSSVTSIGLFAFKDCKLHNILIKCEMPPDIEENAFTNQTFYHAMLYIPSGSWDAYAYDDNWYRFINIRETAMAEEDVSEQQAYMLMDAETFAYSVYDPVNDCIGTINSIGSINEDNPYHSWQMMEAGGLHYLYNIGAKKYAKREGNSLSLCDEPTPIDVADGDNGLILAGETSKQWALVSNERLSASQAAIDQVTGIKAIEHSPLNIDHSIYNMSGQRLSKPQKGLNIVGGRKVLMK